MCSYKDVKELLIGDRNALLVAIRVTGYGSEYITNVGCPKCKKNSEFNFDLGNLEINTLEVSPVKEGTKIFEFKLPVSKKVVHFKLIDADEDEKIEEEIANTVKLLGANSVGRVTHRLFSRIVSIDGVVDRDQIKKFVNIMPAYDSKSIRDYMSKIEPSLDMRTDFKCPHCQEESKVLLPIGRNFFWPS